MEISWLKLRFCRVLRGFAHSSTNGVSAPWWLHDFHSSNGQSADSTKRLLVEDKHKASFSEGCKFPGQYIARKQLVEWKYSIGRDFVHTAFKIMPVLPGKNRHVTGVERAGVF